MISDQSVRERVTHDHETLFAVDAGAGTGKTTLLVSRLIALLIEKKAKLSRIAAITFTEKAAAELAERLRSKLEESLVKQADQKILILQALEDMEKAPISTIHSFCAGLLREYPVEAGVDPQFTLLDEVQSRAFEAQAWEHWLKQSLSKPVEPLFHFQRLGGAFEHLEELKQFLKRNRTLLTLEPAKPLPSMEPLRDQLKAFVVLTKKEAAQCAKPDDSLYKVLEGFWAGWESLANLPAEDLGFELANFKIPKVGNKGTQVNWGKERLASLRDGFVKLAEDHQAAFAPFKDAVVLNLVRWIWDYFTEWEEQKGKGGFLDFDDLLLKTRDLLFKHPEVREELKDRFDYLFVDEFQDTDPLQVEIVFFLGEQLKKTEKDWKKVKLEPGKLFLVGDPKQSIYRFRRADVAIYEATKERILANGGQVEILSENFRTVGFLVEWVNGLFASQFEGTGIEYHPLTASRKAGATEGTLPLLWGLKIPKDPDEKPSKGSLRQWEAEWTAAFLKDLLNGGFTVSDPKTHEKRPVRPGDIALLFRDISNDVEEAWEEALRRRGLSYQIVGGKRFYNRPEIVALSTLLTCLCSPADEAATVALLRSPIFGFSDEELFLHRANGGKFQFQQNARGKVGKAFQILREWFKATRSLAVSETLAKLYKCTNLLAVTAGQPHGEQRVANLYKVLDQARELEASQHFTYRAFTQWLTTQQEEGTLEGEAPGPDSTEDRITLMTIHKAKGLEFPLVFVSAWAADPKDSGSLMDRKRSTGAFKVGSADLGLKTLNYDGVKEEEELQRKAEDTRLLYVAATRARDCLLLPYFDFAPDGKFKNESLFAGPLLKALEEKKDTYWVEAKEGAEPLNDPPAWVVPLDEKPGPALDAEKEKLKEEKKQKRKKIEALSGRRDFTTVTSLAHGDEEKKEREERVFEEPESASPWGGKGFGVLAHRLLEKGWDWDASLIEKAALAWAPLEGLAPEAAQEAAQMASRALSHPILIRARKSSRLLRELPLSLKQEDGTYLKAVMDLVFQEGDEWVIVDYKTDRDPALQAEAYRKQIEHYAELLEKTTGRKVKEAGLYFLRQDGSPAWKRIK
jgi:ATP-dependent exoDNAse (exonuclease V) beta subunit